MRALSRFFDNLPIERKLLLTSVIPVVALVVFSLVTYRSLQTFSEDQEQLDNIYVVQRAAADYMRLIVDHETGFRGYVLTRQENYLQPYRYAKERIVHVGTLLETMVEEREAQRELIGQVRQEVTQLIADKEVLIGAVKAGRTKGAHDYLDQGVGRTLMLKVREEMGRFDQLERAELNKALTNIKRDRARVGFTVLGGGALVLLLLILTLHLIARSITTPLAALAKAVGTATGGTVPRVPVLDRSDEIGNLTRVMGAMSAQISDHISKIEKSEAELRSSNLSLSESEAKYRSIVDHAPFGIFTTNGMTVTFSNRFNRLLAGLDPDDANEPPGAFRKRIHPEDRERVLREYAEAVAEDRPYETVFRFLHRDGTVRKVLSRRIPIRDDQGRTVMYQGFNVDITALDHMEAQLGRAERLAMLGQVAAGIAHEIRNPLVGIGANVRLLLDEMNPSDPRRADLDVILRETRRLDRIVNQIVEYARPRAVVPTPFSVAELIKETLALLEQPLAAKQIAVKSNISPLLPHLSADRDQVKQVLLNVVQNAIEADPEGGHVEIAASDCPRQGEAGMLIEIRDDGQGISEAEQVHVFEPFFTSGKRGGTGLGLAICRNIIDAHGGNITLESAVGLGTVVRIWMPIGHAPHRRKA